MKITIRIDAEAQDNRRKVFADDIPSYHLTDEELQSLLRESGKGFWKKDQQVGANIGGELFRILNGSGRQLERIVNDAFKTGKPLELYLDIPYHFSAIPFELLWDKDFLLLRQNPQIHIIRKVSSRNSRNQTPPEKNPLKILFMACSPTNLPANQVLQFEKEEEKIWASVEKLQADLIIEDSGSLSGLSDSLIEGGGRFDMLHITGHANIEHQTGPVFYMEDDIGSLDKVTPDRLWEALRDFPPKLLFLSGCLTAKSDKVSGAESFAFQMVEKGIPMVLGWGLPVSDIAATRMTAELYRCLGMGKSATEAVHSSRQAMKNDYHPWNLLRLFSDDTPLQPLIAPGQKLRRFSARKTTHTFLANSHVRILEKGFVGRRREIQKGVQVLKGIPENNESPRCGLLIRGPAGIGKSCLAGKLIERFHDHELLVIHGKLTAPDLIIRLKNLFDRKGNSAGLDILKQDIDIEDKLKALFRCAFEDMPMILYFDDFEQNLIQEREPYILTSEAVKLLAPILTASDWTDGQVRLMISSRYPFALETDGENLAGRLADITLASFQDSDLEKKIAECPNIGRSSHKQLYLNVGSGNPRLLDWLEKIAEDEKKYDLKEIEQLLEKERDRYIGYIADILKNAEGTDFSRFLSQAAVFRRPVKAEAYDGFGDRTLLERGVNLTLIEKEHSRGHEAVYRVMPVIREQQWNGLSAEQQDSAKEIASRWYDKLLENEGNHSYTSLQEGVYHALKAKRVRQACRHAIPLGHLMNKMQLYYEFAFMQQEVANQVSDEVIAEAIREKDKNVAVLLSNLGAAYDMLGDYPNVIRWTEKALPIDIEIFGENHQAVAIRYNNLGAAYKSLGEYAKAIEFYNRALDIDQKNFGENHPNVAREYNNLGLAYDNLGEYEKAIEFYQRALGINRKNFGENHPHIAIDYNNLGMTYHALGKYEKAIEFLRCATDIDLNNFGENHPSVAREYNNLGLAYYNLGQYEKAIEFYERALEILRNFFDDNHPSVKRTMNNLELAKQARSVNR